MGLLPLFVVVVGGLLLALNVWGVIRAYHDLIDMVPGWSKHGSAAHPRAFATGRARPSSGPLRAPLSGRPCVAWRLSVGQRNDPMQFGEFQRVYDRYSGGSFSLVSAETETPIRLTPCAQQSTPPWSPRAVSHWFLPHVESARAFTMQVYGGVPCLALGHDLSEAQARAARQAAAAELARYDFGRTGDNDTILVMETIVDLETTWVCEGPRGGGPDLAIVTQARTKSSPPQANVVKLAPARDLRRMTRRTILRAAALSLFFDVWMVLAPALHILAGRLWN